MAASLWITTRTPGAGRWPRCIRFDRNPARRYRHRLPGKRLKREFAWLTFASTMFANASPNLATYGNPCSPSAAVSNSQSWRRDLYFLTVGAVYDRAFFLESTKYARA